MRLIIAYLHASIRVLSTQLRVLHDQLRVCAHVLILRKCADFHENRLVYAYLSTRACMENVPNPLMLHETCMYHACTVLLT